MIPSAKGLRDHPEIVAYHPRATIIIGRSSCWDVEKVKALHGLNQRLSGINIMTYDHLLQQGENMVKLFSRDVSKKTDTPEHLDNDLDDDVPF